MSMLSVVDPLQNVVFFDSKTIGLAILQSDLNSFIHELLRKTLKDPVVILEVNSEKRIYAGMNNNCDLRVVNVVFKDDIWYAENIDVEIRKEDLYKIIKRNKAIYKK